MNQEYYREMDELMQRANQRPQNPQNTPTEDTIPFEDRLEEMRGLALYRLKQALNSNDTHAVLRAAEIVLGLAQEVLGYFPPEQIRNTRDPDANYWGPG